MAKNWYPVIDYLLYQECGSCSDMCAHGVYDPAAAPSPRVIHPENCVDHCHGCGTQCPAGAITYVGEDTGWVPPAENGETETAGSCCCGSTRKNQNAENDGSCGCRCSE